MARIIVHRALPFQRGDMSINISVDGKPAGTFLSNNSLEIEAAPGVHQLRASSNGGRGRKYSLDLSEQGEVHLQVQMPSIKFLWWPIACNAVIFGIPERVFGPHGFLVQMALGTAVAVALFFSLRPHWRKWLRIEPMPDAVSATHANAALH
jgi:hypothetical protein